MFSTTSSGGQGKQVGIVLLFCAALCQLGIASEPIVIQSGERLVHLRSGGGPDAAPEWTEFAESTPIEKLDLTFQSSFIDADLLEIHQQDVKQAWKVRLNDTPLEPLPRDENDLVISLPVPEGALREGENRLTIEGPADAVDDIRLGQIRLHPRSEKPWLQQCQLTVHVTDKSTREATPCRLTILNSHGALQTVHVPLRPLLAVRPGVIYAGDGDATFSLPAGEYTIFAGRGFEYSLAQQSVQLTAGDSRSLDLSIEREVSTTGYVACDTHVHTLTHSGHGDCSIEERMVTLAGEGIELAIATDHNKQIDYRPAAQELGLLRHFTPVIGNEVTTKTGHFNMFPLPPIEPRPDHTFTDWGKLGAEFDRHSEAQVIILNHARDLHSGVRPFGPLLFNAAIGTRFDGQPIPANAMEVINSGATQTDPLQLFGDWMTLLNQGLEITPVGCSDSHDVARHFVGQGRTYIRCNDDDPGNIEVPAALAAFRRGEVGVSYGLLTELTLGEAGRPGMLVTTEAEQLELEVRVLGPHWVSAERLLLFANGEQILDVDITERDSRSGIVWSGELVVERPRHDVHYVALALGGETGLYWRAAKAYQPTSPDWKPHTLGCSGALWVDADGNGHRDAAIDYARAIMTETNGDLTKVIDALRTEDAAIAAQTIAIWHQQGGQLDSRELADLLKQAAPPTRTGVQLYRDSLRA